MRPEIRLTRKLMGLRWRECEGLGDVLELIGDGPGDGAFTQEQLVRPIEQAVVHLFAQFGDFVQSLSDEQVLG